MMQCTKNIDKRLREVHNEPVLYGAVHKFTEVSTGELEMSENKPFNPMNPFANMDISKFDLRNFDFSKMLSELKVPGIDIERFMGTQRKNIEAVVSANKVAVEGMQAIAKRQAEMLAEAMEVVSTATQQLAGVVTNPQEMTSKQAELTREALEKALANMRELAEMVGKSNSEAFQVMNTRFSESLQDLKGLTEVNSGREHAAQPKPPKSEGLDGGNK
jgi:phasin family protein